MIKLKTIGPPIPLWEGRPDPWNGPKKQCGWTLVTNVELLEARQDSHIRWDDYHTKWLEELHASLAGLPERG